MELITKSNDTDDALNFYPARRLLRRDETQEHRLVLRICMSRSSIYFIRPELQHDQIILFLLVSAYVFVVA